MKLFMETTQAMSVEITDTDSNQLKVITVIDGIKEQKIVDPGASGLDFLNSGMVLVGKLRFMADEVFAEPPRDEAGKFGFEVVKS